MILSMTMEERRNPSIIGGSRRLRIARGSGTTTHQVNALLKQFGAARKMMRQVLGGRGLRLPGLQTMAGLERKEGKRRWR
jgi:signal recognition particle subunit SRP54